MRPVDKGESPYETIKEYEEALPYLEEKLGLYCSYCEMPIKHAPEVEHIVSKSRGGDLTDWSNLILGCKYCNSRKLAATTPHNKNDYLWPDDDNTAIAYLYTNGFPMVNKDILNELDPTELHFKKAQNTYDMIKLGNVPQKRDKDKRFPQRNMAYHKALISLKNWQNTKDAPETYQNDMKEQIIMTATAEGFFSVWMTVFYDEPEILNALIASFPGTKRSCYDESGKIRKVL
ncbi:HNH endonuclease [Agathobacter sp.]